MHSSTVCKLNDKISFVPGVSQFPSEDNKFLFLKHNNRLLKISARSDLVKQSKIFHVLQHPRSLSEILKLMSEFKENDVVILIQTLYKLNLIRVESKLKNNDTSRSNALNRQYLPRSFMDRSNNKSHFDFKLVLIGSGRLVKKLALSLKSMNIKFDTLDPLQIFHEFGVQEVTDRKHVRRSKIALLNLSYSPSSLIANSDLVVVAEDYHNLNLFETVNEICCNRNKPWLRLSIDDNIGYLGPFVIPRETSCFNCCELRLVTNSPNYEYELWVNKHNIPKTNLHVPVYVVEAMLAKCLSELIRFFVLRRQPETTNNIFLIETEQMNLTKHNVISHPNR